MEGLELLGTGGPAFPSSYEPSILGPESPKDPSFHQDRDLHVFPPGTFLMNRPLATWDLSPIPPSGSLAFPPRHPGLSRSRTQRQFPSPILIICISCSKELEEGEGEGHGRGISVYASEKVGTAAHPRFAKSLVLLVGREAGGGRKFGERTGMDWEKKGPLQGFFRLRAPPLIRGLKMSSSHKGGWGWCWPRRENLPPPHYTVTSRP